MHDYNDIARRQRELAEESGGNSMAVNVLASTIQNAFEHPEGSLLEDGPFVAARRRAKEQPGPKKPAEVPRAYCDELEIQKLVNSGALLDKLLPESLEVRAAREAKEKAETEDRALQEKIRRWFAPDFRWIDRAVQQGRK